jgi:hypothetical protein
VRDVEVEGANMAKWWANKQTEKVERVARAISRAARWDGEDKWDDLLDWAKDEYRKVARAALDAMK